jgi:hypothetical protein
MPDQKNIEWEKFLRQRMRALKLPHDVQEDVIAELAGHLQEACEEANARGLNQAEASHLALEQIDDWNVLTEQIFRAKSKEGSMNARTRSFWLPALASLLASSLFLFVLTELSMQPPLLVRLTFSAARSVYAVWIIGQIAFGSLGAFLSRRVGGSRTARIVAATFPAIVMLASCAIVIPVSALMEHNEFIFHDPGRLWWGTFLWAVVPAATLLLGAAPFLKEPAKRPA